MNWVKSINWRTLSPKKISKIINIRLSPQLRFGQKLEITKLFRARSDQIRSDCQISIFGQFYDAVWDEFCFDHFLGGHWPNTQKSCWNLNVWNQLGPPWQQICNALHAALCLLGDESAFLHFQPTIRLESHTTSFCQASPVTQTFIWNLQKLCVKQDCSQSTGAGLDSVWDCLLLYALLAGTT